VVYSPTLGRNVSTPTPANFVVQDLAPDVEVELVNLVAEDDVVTRGLYYRRRGTQPQTALHVMHPRNDQSQNYVVPQLVAAGYGVLARSGRWPNNDVATIHETLLLDVAAGITFLRERGHDHVVLLGNSGGSSLAALYQQQAELAPETRLADTPAGDVCDLRAASLNRADGLVLLAGHLGEGHLLRNWIDPSVIDEQDPTQRHASLDMYDPANGYREPPAWSSYEPEFIKQYRGAQLDRVRRLDKIAHELIEQQRAGIRGSRAKLMVIYRTAADLAFTDLSLEPDDRSLGTYRSGDPKAANDAPDGFARYLTPQAWLSTWSALSSRADTIKCLSAISVPTLIVHYAGDAGARLSDVQSMLDASLAESKDLRIIRDTDHFGFRLIDGGRSQTRDTAGVDEVISWLERIF
jgi:pimeloyl-ACP methyl ester carboxylesterase